MKPTLFFIPLLGFLLSACSTPAPKRSVKDLCSGTKRPYQINGVTYTPQDHYDYEEQGVASWYGPGFHGKPGSCGSRYDMYAYTAAHKTLPIPSVVEVTNVSNGKKVHLVINDRGPFVGDRIIDLSKKAAMDLGTHGRGLGKVHVRALPEESKALATYLKQFGAYGLDPRGRSWDQIYFQEVANKAHEVKHLLQQEEESTPSTAQTTVHTITATAERPYTVSVDETQDMITDLIDTHEKDQEDREFQNLVNQMAGTPKVLPVAKFHPPHESSSRYYVQVGSFVNKENALKVRESLSCYGNAQVVPQPPYFHTVKIGPFRTGDQAQKAMNKIMKAGHHGVSVHKSSGKLS